MSVTYLFPFEPGGSGGSENQSFTAGEFLGARGTGTPLGTAISLNHFYHRPEHNGDYKSSENKKLRWTTLNKAHSESPAGWNSQLHSQAQALNIHYGI